MKYFYTLFIAITFSLISITVFSQGFYFSFNAGYGLGKGTQSLDGFNNSSDEYFSDYINYEDRYEYTEEKQFVSLGQGFNFGGTVGGMFNKHIGAELGVSYLLGSKWSVTKDYRSEYVDYSETRIYEETTTYTLYSRMIRIIPSIVVAGGFEKIDPYAKFGLLIGTGSVMTEQEGTDEYTYEPNMGSTVHEEYDFIYKRTFDGGIALGISAAAGVNFNLDDHLSLFCEINTVNLSYAPKRSEYTEAEYDGDNVLRDWETNQIEFEYVDTYEYDSDDPPDDDDPSQEIKHKLPFGSVGFNFGLKIRFFKAKDAQ